MSDTENKDLVPSHMGKFHMCVHEVLDAHDKSDRIEGHEWTGIVIHHTGTDGKQHDAKWWKRFGRNMALYLARKDNAFVSAHFVIDREGTITQLVHPDYHKSWHAGKSSFWNSLYRKVLKSCNNYMIGIELVGDGNLYEYTAAQYRSCARVCGVLLERYHTLQPNCIVGHEMVSPGRKKDPGRFFNWRKLYQLMYAMKGR